MDPISAIIGGGASLLGGFLSQSASRDAADRQMQFQQMMSNTAYQRASVDMKAAGLNPMMMFGGGSAASTPAGAIPQTGQVGAGVGNAVNSALNSSILQKTIDKLTEEISRTKAETGLKEAQQATEKQRPYSVIADTWNTIADTYLKRGQFDRTDLEALQARYGKEFFDTPSGKLLYQAGLGGKGVSDVIRPVSDFLGSVTTGRKAFRRSLYDDSLHSP